jgi:FMNH2-dependent dimethyl sulfone monooxygenase
MFALYGVMRTTPNISGGMMSSAAKNKLDWNENVDVARKADQAGWEFLLLLGRWRGHGGPNNPNAEQPSGSRPVQAAV